MATKKRVTPEFDLRDATLESQSDWDSRVVSTKWGIKEYRADVYGEMPEPAFTEGVDRLVSPEFDTKEEAWAWAEGYDPAAGTAFKIAKIQYVLPKPVPRRFVS